jgi:hypothetical protein
VAVQTGSVGLLGDAIHNLFDVSASAVGFRAGLHHRVDLVGGLMRVRAQQVPQPGHRP